MPQVTIADLDPVPAPMNGAELVEIERGGVSYRTTTGALAVAPPSAIPIVSDPVSQDLDPLGGLYEVTTSGAGAVDILNLPNIDGSYDAQNIGRMLIITFAAQTDPGDTIKIKVGGSDNINVWSPSPTIPVLITTTSGVVLQNPDETAAFLWIGDAWRFAPQFTDFADATTLAAYTATLLGGPDVAAEGRANGAGAGGGARVAGGAAASGAGGALTLAGGDAVAGSGNGGAALLMGGDADGGDGGNVTVRAGISNNGGDPGHVLITGLPTADPVVAGALWNSAGTLKISAGP